VRINVAIPEAHVDEPVLNAALEAVTRLDESLLKAGEIPTCDEGIKKGIRWKPEPPGQEHFDHAALVMKRSHGDCDDLAPWQAASLRATGKDPEARAIVYKSGPKRWHAVVKRGDGTIDDPSKRAGMGQPQSVVGAALPLMYTAPSAVVGGVYRVRPAIAMRPIPGGMQSRVDLPWFSREQQGDPMQPTDYAMVTLHGARSPDDALVGAIEGACRLGVAAGFAHPDHLDRLAAIAEALDGMPLNEVSDLYGDSHAAAAEQVIGSLWGGIKNIARKATGPLASRLVKFVPGVGPIASEAMDVTRSAMQASRSAPRVTVPESAPIYAQPRTGRICIPATWEG
jgi:hypothetical protein